jgi:C-terminal processing protease CtpA/Prc
MPSAASVAPTRSKASWSISDSAAVRITRPLSALADRFFAGEEPMVDWGEGWKKSSIKTNALAIPITILVNRKTSGAAEVLAGILRYRQLGLLIGTNTAGQASMAREFALKTGQRLRVAVAPVKVTDGHELPVHRHESRH